MPEPHPYNIAYNTPKGDILVGVDHNAPPPPTQVVHLGGPVNVWNITVDAIAPNVDLIVIGDYQWTGLSESSPQDVIAIQYGSGGVYWYVTPAADAPEGYSIIAWDHDHSLVWTVEDPGNPKSNIVLKTIGDGPTPSSQWFKLLRA